MGRIAAVVPAVFAACLWFPLERLFYDALGFDGSLLLMGRAAMMATTLAPLLAEAGPRGRLAVIAVAGAGLLVCAVSAVLLSG